MWWPPAFTTVPTGRHHRFWNDIALHYVANKSSAISCISRGTAPLAWDLSTRRTLVNAVSRVYSTSSRQSLMKHRQRQQGHLPSEQSQFGYWPTAAHGYLLHQSPFNRYRVNRLTAQDLSQRFSQSRTTTNGTHTRSRTRFIVSTTKQHRLFSEPPKKPSN